MLNIRLWTRKKTLDYLSHDWESMGLTPTSQLLVLIVNLILTTHLFQCEHFSHQIKMNRDFFSQNRIISLPFSFLSKELNYADITDFPMRGSGTVQPGIQDSSSEYAQVRVSRNATATTSPPTYDIHMQRIKRPAPQPNGNGPPLYAEVRKHWTHSIQRIRGSAQPGSQRQRHVLMESYMFLFLFFHIGTMSAGVCSVQPHKLIINQIWHQLWQCDQKAQCCPVNKLHIIALMPWGNLWFSIV